MLNEESASGLPDDAMGDFSNAFQQYLAIVDPEETTVSSDDDAESGDESIILMLVNRFKMVSEMFLNLDLEI